MRLRHRGSSGIFRGDFSLHGCSMYPCVYVFRHMHAMACVKVREQIRCLSLPFFLFKARFLFACSACLFMQGLFLLVAAVL